MRANRPLSHPFSADDINYTDAVYQRAFWFIGHCKYGGIIIMAAADLRTTEIGIQWMVIAYLNNCVWSVRLGA